MSTLLLAAGVAAGAAACEPDAVDGPGLPDAPEWQLEEDLRIGSLDDPDQALTMIGGVLPLPDGGAWVLQPQDRAVRIYEPDGALHARIGGPGQGPGEFVVIGGAGWWRGQPDTFWVADAAVHRMNLFTPDGAFLRSFVAPPRDHGERLTVARPAVILPDGSALALATYKPGGPEWDGFPLVRYRLEEEGEPQELARVERTSTMQVRWQGVPVATGAHPIPDAPLVSYAPDGGRVTIADRSVVPGDADPRVEVLALDPDGDTVWVRSFRYQPRLLSEAELDSVVRPRIEGFQRFAALDGSLSDSEAEQAFRQSVRIPEHWPPLSAAHTDPEGRVWLQWVDGPETPGRLWVLDGEGELHAQITPPQPLTIRAIGREFLWASETDELDVPYLVRYRIVPLPPTPANEPP